MKIKTISPLLFLAGFILSNIAFYLTRHEHPARPYVILYDNPTPDDEQRCRNDYPNCMDVMDIEVLPSDNADIDCTTDADCCKRFPDVDPEFCFGEEKK